MPKLKRLLKRGKYGTLDGVYTVTRRNKCWEIESRNDPELLMQVPNLKEARAVIETFPESGPAAKIGES